MGRSVLCSAPVVVASHAAYGPSSFVVRAFVDLYRVGPGPLLGNQFLLLNFVVFFVFGLEVALEGAKSPRGEASLRAWPGFVAKLICEAVDGVHISEL